MVRYLLLYLLFINLAAAASMLLDKRRARHRGSRIPERTLFGLAFAGGTVGIWAGMYRLHHKTQKTLFRLGIPVLFFLQLRLATFWAASRYPGIFRR